MNEEIPDTNSVTSALIQRRTIERLTMENEMLASNIALKDSQLERQNAELLAALRELVVASDEYMPNSSGNSHVRYARAVSAARAAIARALG